MTKILSYLTVLSRNQAKISASRQKPHKWKNRISENILLAGSIFTYPVLTVYHQILRKTASSLTQTRIIISLLPTVLPVLYRKQNITNSWRKKRSIQMHLKIFQTTIVNRNKNRLYHPHLLLYVTEMQLTHLPLRFLFFSQTSTQARTRHAVAAVRAPSAIVLARRGEAQIYAVVKVARILCMGDCRQTDRKGNQTPTK